MIDIFVSDVLRNSPLYDAWGNFVASEILRTVVPASGLAEKELLKIPLKVRLKEENSIRAKIARYELLHPKDEITDLVGIRFVVLLKSQLNLFSNAIETSPLWAWMKVKDSEKQAADSPEIFDYQSIHYILSASSETASNGVEIPPGTSCEVQIRTLLQHAYAELTHDNIYKPVHIVPRVAKRYVARSMALMETTDELFDQTLNALRVANAPRNAVFSVLAQKFSAFLDIPTDARVDERINFEVIEKYIDLVPIGEFEQQIGEFLTQNEWLKDVIIEHYYVRYLFSQPIVLMLAWLVKNDKAFTLTERWDLQSLREDLRLVFNIFGQSFGDQL